MAARSYIARESLRILCALLLVFVGMAHQRTAARDLSPTGLFLYVLPDGSTPRLCLPNEDDEPIKAVSRDCEFCRIASGALLPPPPADGVIIARWAFAVALPVAMPFATPDLLEPGASPRGPPAFLA